MRTSLRRLFKPHLGFSSVEAWGESLGDFDLKEVSDADRDCFFKNLGELRQHLYDLHLVDLSGTEREQLATGQHPAQSHSRHEQAKLIFDEFRIKCCGFEWVRNSKLTGYHGDRHVIWVGVADDIPFADVAKHIPPWYRGFEIKIHRASKSRTIVHET